MDPISRQAAIDAMMKLQAEDDEAYGGHIPEGFDGKRAKEALESLPSAQPEIVRCKDCIFTDGEGPITDGRYWCVLHESFMYFCSDAERRKG